MNNSTAKTIFYLSFILIIILLFSTSAGRAVNIQVAPRRFIFPGDHPLTEEVNVFNSSEQVIRVRVETEPPEGQPEEEYLGDWIKVYPRVISIEPGQQRVVRFSLRTPEEEVPDGEYRSLLFFEELPPEEDKNEKENKEDQKPQGDEVSIDFDLLTKIGINLYGQFGEIEHKGQLRNTEIENREKNIKIKGNFVNQGNAHLRMEVAVRVYNSTDKLIREENNKFVVHRGAEKDFAVEFAPEQKLKNGKVELEFVHHDQVTGKESIIEEVTTEF
ncbi:MAG: fimbria/pilus periplasmic chaperone [Halanaerobiaceae bacterium]